MAVKGVSSSVIVISRPHRTPHTPFERGEEGGGGEGPRGPRRPPPGPPGCARAGAARHVSPAAPLWGIPPAGGRPAGGGGCHAVPPQRPAAADVPARAPVPPPPTCLLVHGGGAARHGQTRLSTVPAARRPPTLPEGKVPASRPATPPSTQQGRGGGGRPSPPPPSLHPTSGAPSHPRPAWIVWACGPTTPLAGPGVLAALRLTATLGGLGARSRRGGTGVGGGESGGA